MALVENVRIGFVVGRKFRNPPNAVDDDGIDLKRWPRTAREHRPTWAKEPQRPAAKPSRYYMSDDEYVTRFYMPRRPSETTFRDTTPVNDIIATVAGHYGISTIDIRSSRRTAKVVFPRHVAMYLAKQLTTRSLPDIGRRFGGRDHTTVLHAVRKIEALIPTDPLLAETINELKNKVRPLSEETS